MKSFLRRSKLRTKRTICAVFGHDLTGEEIVRRASQPAFDLVQVYCRRCPFGTVGTREEVSMRALK